MTPSHPVMKTILLPLALASGLAFGQTAYTTPVGYFSVTVPNASDTNISVPLQNSSSWSGASTGISGDVVSVAVGSYTDSAYAGTHMLQVTSGVLVGRTFPILSNGTANLTVDPVGDSTLQDQGFVSTDKFAIRPYWTLNTLFPAGAGIGQNSDVFAPTTLILLSDNNNIGLNRSASALYFYHDGSQGPAGWYKNGALGDGLQNNVQLPPSTVITIRNQSGAEIKPVISGEVPSVPAAALVISGTVSNDNFVQLPYPVDTTLDQSNLLASGAVADSPDVFSPVDLVLVFNPAGTGFNPSASALYFHHDGSQGPAGWYKNGALGDGLQGSVLLKAGSSVIIRKAAAAALEANTWTAPLPYSVAN